MPLSLPQLEFCRTLVGEALLVADLPDDPLAALEALRKECTPAQAAAVMELRRIRTRAERSGKLPRPWAARLLATDTLLQQASSLRLAVYVGSRLVRLAGRREVVDLCCGLGLNSIGLSLAGAEVAGYDIAEHAVLCAGHNAGVAGVADRCRFSVADVTQLAVSPDAVIHIDPDRRSEGRRAISLSRCSPSEGFLRSLPQRCAEGGGALKLSAALGLQVLADWPDVELEYTSESGVCKQLIVWWGSCRAGDRVSGPEPPRRATVVFGEMTAPLWVSLPAGLAARAPLGEPGGWLIEPDPAVIAAEAVDDLAALLTDEGAASVWRIDPHLAWLFSDRPLGSALARCFRILKTVPGRLRDVARAVVQLDGGVVEVKPRGVKLDTDALQGELRGRGDRPLTVLWGKVGRKQQAFITERCDRGAGSAD